MSNMVVRTNVLALNSHRNLSMVGTQQAKASARLSSGFRINSAADDAAGLAISEKMRSQIRGLDQASRNAQDGISLIQTAEGAMATINDMVNRVRELIVQATNDTNVHDVGRPELSDRQRIQDEINQLLDEVDATAMRTEFNTRKLLDGSLSADGQPRLTEFQRMEISSWLATNEQQVNALASNRANVGMLTQVLDNLKAEQAFLQQLQSEVNGLADTAQTVQNWVDGLNERWLAYASSLDPANTGPQAQMDWINQQARSHFGLASTVNFVTAVGQMNEGFANLSFGGATPGNPSAGITAIAIGTSLAQLQDSMTAFRTSAAQGGNWGTGVGQWGLATAVGTNNSNGSGGPGATINMPAGVALASGWAAAGTRLSALTPLINDQTSNVAGQQTHANASLRALNDLMRGDATGVSDGLRIMFRDFDAMMDAYNYEPTGDALWFQIGANAGQGISLNIESVKVADLVSKTQFDGLIDRIRNDQTIATAGEREARADQLALLLDAAHMGGNGRDMGLGFLRTVIDGAAIPGLASGTGGILEVTGKNLTDVLSVMDIALAHTTSQRSALGAVQNRLEFTIENLNIASENLSASESRIRDADMAKEMMRLTQANVLQQAATSMLAQANQAPFAVLQLLG